VVVEEKERPEVSLSLRLAQHLNKLEAKLGLSPADRVGIKTVGPSRSTKAGKGKSRFFAGAKRAVAG